MIVCGLALLAAVIAWSTALPDDVGETLTRNTVRLSLTWYSVALCLMMRLTASDWLAASTIGRLARWCWTWALICFLVHLGMAFHYYHHWSHAAAFEHTRQLGGVGEGIFMSYLFTCLWIADVGWWWARPKQYADRSPWLDRLLHAFMLFMVFNGTVVFESGLIRWAGLVLFAVLSAVWLVSRGVRRVRFI